MLLYLKTILLLLVIIPNLAESNTLRFVTALWRHGDRTASSFAPFPSDTENGPSSWPQGLGELTPLGMKQHQCLGRYLRKRYVEEMNFLSANYYAPEIYVRSTDYNRTIMSALANLAGMYPLPAGTQYFDQIPVWQPIPVHTVPERMDQVLLMVAPCPIANDMFNYQMEQSDEAKRINRENEEFFEYLKNQTGLKKVTFDLIYDIWDVLNCEKIHSDTHKYPNWVTEELFEKLTELMHVAVSHWYSDPKLQHFRGSLLFNEIAIRMDQVANRPDQIPNLKYYAYSGHDGTIIALLENLGAFNGRLPPYASVLLFELHEESPAHFVVKTFYLNETDAAVPPFRLSIKDCDRPSEECKLETFVQLARSKIPEDFDAECGLLSSPHNTNRRANG